jgi:hypothetical protein
MKKLTYKLIRLFLLILSTQVFVSPELLAQTSYETATYLCNTNSVYTLSTPPTNVPAQVGPDYGCVSGASNALWFRFQVSSGNQINWQLLPTNNSNLDFILWGPFTNPDPGVSALNAANTRFCTNDPILVENLVVNAVVSNSYYILAVFNSDRTAGNFSFVPQANNNVVLGSAILSAPANPSTITQCTPPFTIATFPVASQISNLNYSGNGIIDAANGVFSPSLAGVGTHSITITGSPYACAPRIGIYNITVSPCPYAPSISNPSGQNVICWNAFLPPLTAVSPSYPPGISHVSWVWEYKLLSSPNWLPYPISPDNPLTNFVVTGSLEIRVRDILSNGVSVTSAPIAFTVLNPIQVPVVSLVSGPSTLCNGSSLALTATPANGGGNVFQYQWQRNTGSGWVTVSPPSSSPSYNISAVTQSAQYRIIATDISIRQCGSVFSDPISITVQDVVTQGQVGPNPPPSQIEVCMDEPAFIGNTTPATGSAAATLTYKWEESTNGTTWSPIPSSNTPTYSAPALTIPGRRFYRRQATFTLNGVVCPTTPEYSNVVSVTWVDDFPYVSATRLHQFDGPFNHDWQIRSGSGSISGATATEVVLTSPAASSAIPSVSAFYRLTNNIVPFDGIVSFNASFEYFHPACSGPGSWESTPPPSAANLQRSFEISGNPSDISNGGFFAFRVQQFESIGFTIALTGSAISPGNCFGQRIRLRITNFAYHRRGSNGSATICANQPHTVPSAMVASIPSASFVWSIVSGSGSLNNTSLINPTYTPGASDAGNTVILRLTGTRTSGLCQGRTSTADYSIIYRPVFVPASVNPGQDRIVCYNGVGGSISASPATGGSGPYLYQWQSSTNGGPWINIGTGLTLNALTPLTENTCYRILSSDIGDPSCASSVVGPGIVCITVRSPLTAPDINNPSQVLVCPTGTATLVCSTWATGGNGVFKYTWESVDASPALAPGQPHLWPWISQSPILQDQPAVGPLSFTTPPMYCNADRWYRLVAQDQNIPGRAGCGTAWSTPVLVKAFDNVSPTIIPKVGQQLFVGANCSTTVTNVLALVASFSDNCIYQQLWDWKITPSTFGLGVQTAVISAKDTCGNLGSAVITLNVLDNINPVAVAQNIVVNLGPSGTVTPSASLADNGSTDNCSIANRQLIPPTFNCSNIGANPVIFRVTDGSGNQNQTNITVTVQDVTAPVISGCPSNVTLIGYNNGAGSSCVSGYSWTPPTFSDNCDNNISVTASHNPCSVFPQGNTTVTYTAVDDYGNTSTCSFVVTVLPASGGCAPSNPAANPLVEITNVQGNCIGGVVTADIRLSRYSGNLGAISLFLDYDPAVLGNPILTFTNPLLSATGTSTINNPTPGDNRIAWNWSGSGSAPYICDNAVLFTIKYDVVAGGNSPLTFDTNLPVNCELANDLFAVVPSVIFRGVSPSPLSFIQCVGFSGTLTYDNVSSSPIPNTTIKLLNLSGSVVATGRTNASGAYHLPGFGLTTGQTYTVQYTNPNEWGNAVNATDALGIQRHFVGLGVPLSGLALQAADVNSSSTVTTADAALTRARYTSLIAAFTPDIDWVYSVQSMTYTGGLSTINIKSLNTGDVNKSRPSVPRLGYEFLPEGGVLVRDGDKYRADFVALDRAILGAASIQILLPAGAVVSDVKLFRGLSDVVWNQSGNDLYLAWSSLVEQSVAENEVVLSLYFDEMPIGPFLSSINTEFADPWAEIISGFRLAGPGYVQSSSSSSIQVYPNPTQGHLLFSSEVDQVDVTDLHGRLVMNNLSGRYSGLDISALPKGVYVIRLTKGDVISLHKVVLKD